MAKNNGGKKKFNLKNYSEVKDRIKEFLLEFPNCFIVTNMAAGAGHGCVQGHCT